MTIFLFFLLQETDPSNYAAPFLKEGLLGVSIVVLCTVIYKMFKIILTDRDTAVKQRDELLDKYFTEVLPALNNNARLVSDLTDVLKENTRALSRNDTRGGL